MVKISMFLLKFLLFFVIAGWPFRVADTATVVVQLSDIFRL